jgi:hypothetical protein
MPQIPCMLHQQIDLLLTARKHLLSTVQVYLILSVVQSFLFKYMTNDLVSHFKTGSTQPREYS